MDSNSLADVIILLSLFQSENKALMENISTTLKEIKLLLESYKEK